MERKLFAWLSSLLHQIPNVDHRRSRCQFTDRQVLCVWLWAVIHDRPVSWATRRCNWPWHDRTRPLPSQATMSRRLRDLRVIDSIDRWVMLANDHLCQSPGYDPLCALIVDGRPLALSPNSRDPDAAKGRAVGGFGLGYKLHQISDSVGVVHAFTVLPLNTSEIAATHRMLAGLPHQPQGRLLLGDRLFDVNGLDTTPPRPRGCN
ncbi:MAG: hypothetical protein AAF663_03720 [Planctomycetota bacterium]